MPKQPLESFDETKAATKAGDLLLRATNLTVDDPLSARKAREIRREAWLLENHADKHFKQEKEPHAKIIRELNAKQFEVAEPTDMVIAALDPRILAWEENEDKRRTELQKVLEDQARKQAQEAREAQIDAYRQAGNHRAATELVGQPLFVPPVILPERSDFLDGESRGEGWNVVEETVNLIELADAVVRGQLPPSVIEPAWNVLKGMAKAIESSGKIPGCEIKNFIIIKQRS